MIMPPRNWLAAVFEFKMRPQSNDPKKRVMRGSPVTALTRASQNIAPYECMDQCIVSAVAEHLFNRHLIASCALQDGEITFAATSGSSGFVQDNVQATHFSGLDRRRRIFASSLIARPPAHHAPRPQRHA